MNTAIKYPKTFHLPFSLGLQNDDRRLEDETCFDGKTVAVTIKMDGENTSMYRDGIHARSLSSAHHPSRSVVKALHSTIKNDIPEGWRICGENMYAKHSIHYTNLESYFYVFSVWNDQNTCLPLEDTIKFCNELKLTHVKFMQHLPDDLIKDEKLARSFYITSGDFSSIKKMYELAVQQGEEGIVVRNVESYHYNDFQKNLAKAVRKNHIQTDVHWSKSWIPNELKK